MPNFTFPAAPVTDWRSPYPTVAVTRQPPFSPAPISVEWSGAGALSVLAWDEPGRLDQYLAQLGDA